MKNHHPRGFTLLEVLLVCTILSLLIAVAAVSYGRFVERARQVEAMQNLAAIRTGEIMYHEEHGRFIEALDAPAINSILDVGITPRYFNYKVTSTDPKSFLATATPGEGTPSGEPVTIAMNEEGQFSFFYRPASPGGPVSPVSGGSGRGSAGGGGSSGGGGGSGGGSGSGGSGSGGGGSSGSGGAVSIGGTPTGGGSSGTGTVPGGIVPAPPPTVPANYVSRGSDLWTGWADISPSLQKPNIGGTVGVDSLTTAFGLIAASDAHFITDDLLRKGIPVGFGTTEMFPPSTDGTVTFAFFQPYDSRVLNGPPSQMPVIVFNPAFVNEAPGVLAAVLVHEGTHFGQFLDGSSFQGNYGQDVNFRVKIEKPAFMNAAAYWEGVRSGFTSSETVMVSANETSWKKVKQGEAALEDFLKALYATNSGGN